MTILLASPIAAISGHRSQITVAGMLSLMKLSDLIRSQTSSLTECVSMVPAAYEIINPIAANVPIKLTSKSNQPIGAGSRDEEAFHAIQVQ